MSRSTTMPPPHKIQKVGIVTRRGSLKDITNEATLVVGNCPLKKVFAEASTSDTEAKTTISSSISHSIVSGERCHTLTSRKYECISNDDDIDAIDIQNPLMATNYVCDLYDFHRQKEASTERPSNYMDHQPEINEAMRSILVDWLVNLFFVSY